MIFFFHSAVFPVPAVNIPGSTDFFQTRLALFWGVPSSVGQLLFFWIPSQGSFVLGGKIATESPYATTSFQDVPSTVAI